MLQTLYGVAALACLFSIVWLIVAAVRKKAKKVPLIILIVSLVVGVVLNPIVNPDSGTDEAGENTAVSEHSTAPSPMPTATPSPTESPAPDAGSSSAVSDSDSSSDMTLDLMAAAFKLTLQDSFENSDLTYDDDSIMMNVWEDNVAAGALLAKQGNEELLDSWDDMRKNMREMCQAARDGLDNAGFENVEVTLNIKNDMNQDKTLLTIVDGVVVYDAVYDYSMDEVDEAQ